MCVFSESVFVHVIYMQPSSQLSVIPHLDVDPLVQTESDQVERFFYGVSARLLNSTNISKYHFHQ